MKSSCFPLFNLRTTLLLFGAGGLFFAGAWFSYQVVDLNASIAAKTLDIDIRLYPNPVADRLHLSVETAELPMHQILRALCVFVVNIYLP